MDKDYRSPSLQSIGVRTWRGAAIFGLQILMVLLPFAITIKLVGTLIGIEEIMGWSWWLVFISPFTLAFGIFIAVAFHAQLQKALYDLTKI